MVRDVEDVKESVGGIEELGIRVLAGNRIHLTWFTCRD